MQGLPAWLATRYAILLKNFGFMPFTNSEAASVLGQDIPVSILLFRMRERGWARRYFKQNRLVPPSVALLSQTRGDWVAKIKDQIRLPLIEISFQLITDIFGKDLLSIVLFGSVARNSQKEESDIDILLVANNLPKSYSERVKVISSITLSNQIEAWQRFLWEEKKVMPLLDIIPLLPDETKVIHPFYLDLIRDAIILFDRRDFMEKQLKSLSSKLKEANVKRVEFDGGYYWLFERSEKI